MGNTLPLRIVLDEAGTPGAGTELFLTAGFAVRGPVVEICNSWKRLSCEQGFPSKATRFNYQQFLALVQFIFENELWPIAASHAMDSKLADQLKTRNNDFPNHRTERSLASLTHAHSVWSKQVFMTISQCLVSIIQHRGPIDRLDVAVDKFSLTEEMKEFVEATFKSYFVPGGVFTQWVAERIDRYSEEPVLRQLLKGVSAGYKVGPDALSLDLNSKGPLSQIADAVAALFRKSRLGDKDAMEPCQVLCDAFSDRSKIEIDTTPAFSVSANTPWQVLKETGPDDPAVT